MALSNAEKPKAWRERHIPRQRLVAYSSAPRVGNRVGIIAEWGRIMSDLPGWEFCLNDNGRIRLFMVGEENEDTAKLRIQTQFPEVNFLDFISKQRIGPELVKMLGLSGGKGMEWTAGDPRDPIQPRGYDIGSDYDPYSKR